MFCLLAGRCHYQTFFCICIFRFRVLSNALATFISLQLLNESCLRQTVDAPVHMFKQPSSSSPTRTQHNPFYNQGLWCIQHMSGMKTDKHYASFKDLIEYSLTFSCDPAHCITHTQEMLDVLRGSLFPCVNYLGILQKTSQTVNIQILDPVD